MHTKDNIVIKSRKELTLLVHNHLALALILATTAGAIIPAQQAAAADGATVVGAVQFDGPRPQRRRLSLREKRGRLSKCAKLHKKLPFDENILISKDGKLANVFVYVRKGLKRGVKYRLPKKPATLNQVKCMFSPRVQGVRVGQKFVMKNGDPVLHNIRSFSYRNRAFNIAQPVKSADREKIFKQREKAIMIQCDIHPWMKAWFFVIDHPFFAVTNAKGEFKIKGLPSGDYTLSAWHEEFGEQQTKIKVGKSGTIEAGFKFKQTTKKDNGR